MRGPPWGKHMIVSTPNCLFYSHYHTNCGSSNIMKWKPFNRIITRPALIIAAMTLVPGAASPTASERKSNAKTKTETFDRDPGWEGVNNHSARTNEPAKIRQDFGF